MTTSTVSVRTLALTVIILGVVSMSAFAADGAREQWYENQPCTACGDSNGSACGACFEGIDVPYCGDMSPTAMLPGGRWYFQSDFIAIRRQAGQNDVFQTRNTNPMTVAEILDSSGNSLPTPQYELTGDITRDPVLSTDELVFQHAAGYRLLMGWQLAEKYAVEFSYFDLNDWDEFLAISDSTEYVSDASIDPATGIVTVNATQPNSLFSPFTNFGDPNTVPVTMFPDFDYNNLASVRYQSTLDNVELNVRHRVTDRPSRLQVSVLWGGRFNGVRERLLYHSTAASLAVPTTNNVNIRTSNDLWGLQIGTQFDFCWDPGWHTEFEIKGGVAHNNAVYEGVYNIHDGAGGLANYTGRVDKGITTWTGEMRLSLVYQFGQHLQTHVGYQALMLSRLATASGNFEPDLSILADPSQWVLEHNGTAVYHGPTFGFTVAW